MPMYLKEKSKVKLKVKLTNNTETWYSLPKEDKKGVHKSIAGLTRRILQKRHNNQFYYAEFVELSTNRILNKIANFNKSKSLLKLVIYYPNRSKQIFYSQLPDDAVSLQHSEKMLYKRHLAGNPHLTALVIDNINDTIIHKYINGHKIF